LPKSIFSHPKVIKEKRLEADRFFPRYF